MKKLFCVFYLAFVFLFSFSSGAVESFRDSCSAVFEDLADTQVPESSFSSPQKVKSPVKKVVNPQKIINFIPYTFNSTHSKGRLAKEWKDQVLESLPYLSSMEFFSLLDKLANLHNKLDLNHEKRFFKALEKSSVNHITDFNKEQLLNVLWIFVQLNIKSPSGKFVQSWRESAYKKRRDFTSIDRYGARGFFKKLEISAQYF